MSLVGRKLQTLWLRIKQVKWSHRRAVLIVCAQDAARSEDVKVCNWLKDKLQPITNLNGLLSLLILCPFWCSPYKVISVSSIPIRIPTRPAHAALQSVSPAGLQQKLYLIAAPIPANKLTLGMSTLIYITLLGVGGRPRALFGRWWISFRFPMSRTENSVLCVKRVSYSMDLHFDIDLRKNSEMDHTMHSLMLLKSFYTKV